MEQAPAGSGQAMYPFVQVQATPQSLLHVSPAEQRVMLCMHDPRTVV
jgi:hypothetical protein